MKRNFGVVLILGVLLLSGCASQREAMTERIKQQSGILTDDNYVAYQNYVAEGKVDQEGELVEEAEEPTDVINGSIHVTFAKNNNLDIVYYYDESLENQIDESKCYVNPGDSIYATVGISEDIYSSMYEFADLSVTEYTDKGKKVLDGFTSQEEGKVQITFPQTYEGTEVGIVPIGKYQEREISLHDYLVDDNGNREELSGTWMVNEIEYDENTDKAKISAISSYIISYKYNSDEYFYVGSEPECYYNNNDDGTIIFKQREATDDTVDYTVELHKYVSVSVVSDRDREVSVNSGEFQKIKTNTELSVEHLRYGETVTITTDKEWKDLENNRELIFVSREVVDGRYKYVLVAAQQGSGFDFNPSDYTYEHGTIEFKCFGEIVKGSIRLAEKTRIYYSESSAEKGYWLASSGDNYIVVSDAESTIKALKEIHFTPKVQVQVALPQPEFGGKISYKSDGGYVYKTEFPTYSGTDISMEFEPWEGWKLAAGIVDGITYTVKESRTQTITANGKSIGNIFEEDSDHMPALTVVLDESVGEKMRFQFSASRLSQENYTYVDKWFKSTYTLIDAIKIGTEKPISITMDNRALQTNKAVKISIEKKAKTESDNSKEVLYINDLTQLQEPIDIYKNKSNAYSKIWYKSIKLTISVVDINTHSNPPYIANAKVSVTKEDGKSIAAGELIEPSTEVTVTVKADPGYYISGKGVKDDIYKTTIKYSKYLSDIQSIIANHPAKKIYNVTLDKSDSFAKYTYKLNGKEVSGTVGVREGDELSLTYEITENGYKLGESNGALWWKTDKSVTKKLSITSEYDGKTITKTDFGITTKGE